MPCRSIKENKGPAGENPLGTEKISKLLLQFGIPAIISSLVNASYNLVDQVLIGNTIGLLGIAATNVAFPLTPISAAIFYLLGTGGASNYNLRLGEGNKDAANAYAGNTLSLLAIVGTAIGACVLIFLRPLVYAFGATETVMPLAVTYTRIMAIGVPFGIFSTGASALIRADGSPRFSMICTLVGALFNIITDPIIAFGLKWGIAGLAWSSTVSQMITAAIAIYYFMRKAKNIRIIKENLIPKLYLTKRICALGLTPAINQLGLTIVQITMNNVLRYYGAQSIYGSDIPLACVGAISKINVVFTSFPIGIGQGCQPIHGFNYGAKKYDRVKKTLRLALISTGLIALAAFAVFQIFPRQLMSMFGENDPLYLQFAERYLRIYMFLIFFSGVQPIVATFFPAIGKAGRGLLVSLSRQFFFLFPLLLILPRFFGIDGAIYAGPITDFLAATISTILVAGEVRNLTALQRAQLFEASDTF